ncbi:preprotein translocase, SecA subunit [Halobacteroides halobius DSM 5150]|uniref:Protein translocase subunit SecA n=1 Tax=Halobacteroides halobius (strain ATCC 35273 / DSM 5150 / MD-1) TaxID=748449 RepID=L0KAR4_HALHC|nr:preprotein translocase subunit SecA [Halobacteroides halobius]AGB42106.1 preprotein translocase, SecA subunit [Halobacteroides halobius DSM 5150]
MLGLLKKLFPDPNEKRLKQMRPLVDQVNSFEAEISNLTDEQLRAKTDEFKERLANGETVEDLLAESFAVVREAAKRTTGMRHYDVQVLGGIALHQGRIAEMKTGEGKTLAATLPAYLNALAGNVHIITVNDYLAERDSEWMGQIYEFLGLEVGVILEDMELQARKEAYEADILYGTNNQFGFDYLRDNMATDNQELVQGELDFAILDEVDSILIDEARTPLIISGPAQESPKVYYKFAEIANKLIKDRDYEVDEKAQSVILTEAGIDEVEAALKVDNLYDNQHMDELHHINQALKAKELMQRDEDYIVKGGEVHIVDEFTGRLMSGRRFSEGLHQAIEAKEGVKIKRENQTLASITFQNFFRMYEKLSGMTGTAATEAEEFEEIYDLDVVVIPTNEPVIREDHPDVIYKTEAAKFRAVVKDIKECYKKEQPVLVGTVSIDNSEQISRMLNKEHIPHEVLNAKNHEREAEIIKRAGQRGAVTIATNMAGRGTDIVLGAGVVDLGGLHVIGTERHESRRIDNQLRGRSGRQGDPGSSRFYVSLEDDLMRLFGSDKISGIMETLGVDEDQPIEHKLISKSLSNAQKKVESRNFDIRKNILEYDEVLHQQREAIYARRKKILLGQDLTEIITEMATKWLEEILAEYANEKDHPRDWDLAGLVDYLEQMLREIELTVDDLEGLRRDELRDKLMDLFQKAYQSKQEELGAEGLEDLEKIVMLKVIDDKWMDHLQAMDNLRQGIGLRAYGQRDPLVEYKKEGFQMFKQMNLWIRRDIIKYLFAIEVVAGEEVISDRQGLDYTHGDEINAYDLAQAQRQTQAEQQSARQAGAETKEEVKAQPITKQKEPGRNDPCPCGSGKKYKKCCINTGKYGGYNR